MLGSFVVPPPSFLGGGRYPARIEQLQGLRSFPLKMKRPGPDLGPGSAISCQIARQRQGFILGFLWSVECGVWVVDLGLGCRCVCRVWVVGCRVWGFGFRVQALLFRVL